MKRAICTGTFDPVTNGHVDIFERAASLVDELTVCIFVNKKKNCLFDIEERVDLLREATLHIDNLIVDSYDGLVANYVKEHDINIIIRGLRSAVDFEYEYNQAQMNKHLIPEADTLFLMTAPEYLFISSSAVRELALFGGDVHGLVPKCVEMMIKSKKFTEN